MYHERAIRHLFEFVGLADGIRDFRDGIGQLMIDGGHIPRTDAQYGVIREDIRQAKEQAQTSLLTDIMPLLSIIGWLLPTRIPFQEGISVLLGLIVGCRAVTVGIMAYEPPEGYEDQYWLEFKRAWNDGAVNGVWSPVLVPLAAMTMRLWEPGYELGMYSLRRMMMK